MPVPDDYPFDASSPVLRYWLVNGAGFAVCRADGRELGIVEDVVVDPLGQHAEQVIVHRRRRIVGRRRATIDARAFEAVSPAAQRFLVESASGGASAGRPVRRAGSGSRVLAGELLRSFAAGLLLAGRVARIGARAVAHAAVAAAGRTRRESPRLQARLSSSTRTAATRLAAAARVVARALGDLAVLAAVFVAAAWRRVAAASSSRKPIDSGERREPDKAEWRSDADADAPLGRETGGESPSPAREQREATTRRSAPEAGPDRRSDR